MFTMMVHAMRILYVALFKIQIVINSKTILIEILIEINIKTVLTLRLLMSYIYMDNPFLMFLDHTQ